MKTFPLCLPVIRPEYPVTREIFFLPRESSRNDRLVPVNPVLKILWAGAVSGTRLAAHLVPAHGGKLARSLAARVGVRERVRATAGRRDPDRPLVWLHAPSVGEGLQARPILEAIRRASPAVQLAYTWFSPSADAFAARLAADGLVDLLEVLPFDGTAEARTMLSAWRPDVLAFVKLDVWPVLAEQAQQAGVRTALVSATLASNSSRQGRLARLVLGDAYRGLDAVGAISADDAARLVRLGVRPACVSVTGDTRMDQVSARAASVGPDHPVRSLLGPRGAHGSRSDGAADLLVAGSTWPADEAVLLPAFLAWRRLHAGARLIIAPHEPTHAHLAPIERWAGDHAVPLVRLSEAEQNPARDWSVLLVDRVGVLGALYALGDRAFVGGGFHASGLHSVLEPAAYGIPVLFGPRHANAREAGLLVERGGATAVDDSGALLDTLRRWSGNPDARERAGITARALVDEGLGSTGRVQQLIEGLLLSGARR